MKKLKLLVVDDEPYSRETIRDLITKKCPEYEVVDDCFSGLKALEYIKQQDIDIVITDIKMPKLSGIELMREAAVYSPGIKFIVLSAYNDFELVRESLRMGAVDYIIKTEISLERIRASLELARRSIQPLVDEDHTVLIKEGLLRQLLLIGCSQSKLLERLQNYNFKIEIKNFKIISIRIKALESYLKEEFKSDEVLIIYGIKNIVSEVFENTSFQKEIFHKENMEFVVMCEYKDYSGESTRIAGGDIPDIIYREWYSVVQEFAEQGIIRELPYDKVKEWAPKFVEESMDYGADVWLACYYDGKNYGLPFLQPNQNYPNTSTWRTDWLKNVGINKIPETLDEYHEAFKKFTFNDPDKNGKNDTYGLTGAGKSSFPFKSILNSFGVGVFEEDGTMISVEENYKRERKAIETLAQWYKEGIIDPEFVTMDGATLKQKWSNSQTGFMCDGTWYRMMPGGEHYEALKTISPDAQFELGPAPVGPDGYHSYGAMQEGTGSITSSITFSSALDDKTLEKAVKFMYELSSNEEVYTLAKYGIEGTHWKRQDNNLIQPIEPYNLQTNCGDLGVNMFNVVFYPLPSVQKSMNVDNIEEYTKYAKDANIYTWQSWVNIFYGSAEDRITDTGEFSQATWFTNFVTGKTPINDKTWQEYKDAAVKQGKFDKERAIKERIYKQEYPKIEAIIKNLK